MNQRNESGQRVLQPAGWPSPRGFANGIAAVGEAIFLAGQVGCDAEGRFANGFAAQAEQALMNIATLLAEAGAEPRHLTRLTWFVTDLNAYRDARPEVGAAYRRVIGKHFPAMSVIGVSQLVDDGAMVEIEASAMLPPA